MATWASFVLRLLSQETPLNRVAVLEVNLTISSDEFGNSQLFGVLFDAVRDNPGHENFAIDITRAYVDEEGERWTTKHGDTPLWNNDHHDRDAG